MNREALSREFIEQLKSITFLADEKALSTLKINLEILGSEDDAINYSSNIEPEWSTYSWERIKENFSTELSFYAREKNDELYKYILGEFETQTQKISKILRFKCLKKEIPSFLCELREVVSSDLTDCLTAKLLGDNNLSMFYNTMLCLYEIGYYPCGWIGSDFPDTELSNGKLVVFPIKET